ncbi:hypothetical protein [Microvirga zambiensis]|uniref:hypothetical protein n=1 Tax=Microvirga zambiensis TaxID=1402137 RepID=UPI00191FD8CE|nr:hypothetical protein [Microvirga zambiensis]
MIEKLPPLDKSTPLHVYRAYQLKDNGHFLKVFELFCRDDQDAIEQARRLADGRAVEIWELHRKVAFIPAP